MNTNDSKILIIGLGQIGYSNADYIASLGLSADGYDVNFKAIQKALNDKIIKKESKDFKNYDYYLICISTHQPDDLFSPCMEGIFQIAEQLFEEGKEGALVSIESTVAQGTSEKVKRILKHRLHVSHVPHRYFSLEKENHGVRQLRVMGGCEPCCGAASKHLYEYILKIPLHEVSAVEYAELTKVIENSHRYLGIAFAEELKIFCDEYGIDFNELRIALNTKWNVNILEARQGIGGHCLPKDSQMYLGFVNKIMTDSLLNTAKAVDINYRRHIARNQPILTLTSKEFIPASNEKSKKNLLPQTSV